MKQDRQRFIKTGIVFAVVLIIVILLVNAVYVKYILSQRSMFRQDVEYNRFKMNNSEASIIFLGDSHAEDGIRSGYIQDAFNYGMNSENYIKNYYKLKKVVETDNFTIRCVAIEIDPQSFSTAHYTKTAIMQYKAYYSRFMTFDEIVKVRNDSPAAVWFEIYLPFIGQGTDFWNVFLLKPKAVPEKIVNPDRQRLSEVLAEKSKSAVFRYYADQDRVGSIPVDYYTRIIEYAKDNNIKIILLKYPQSKEYLDLMEQRNLSNRAYYADILNITQAAIGNDFKVADYQGIFFSDPEYFSDPDHLNENGAVEFSKIISADLKKDYPECFSYSTSRNY